MLRDNWDYFNLNWLKLFFRHALSLVCVLLYCKAIFCNILVEPGITPVFFCPVPDTFLCNGFGLNDKQPGPDQARAMVIGLVFLRSKDLPSRFSDAGPVSEDLRELADY